MDNSVNHPYSLLLLLSGSSVQMYKMEQIEEGRSKISSKGDTKSELPFCFLHIAKYIKTTLTPN